MRITGIMFYYNEVCRRKLWYFTHSITMENENEDVQLGSLLDEESYSREEKHITIDNTISIDFIKGKEIVCEVKKSKKIEEAGIWQLKYYLWFLKERGVNGLTGRINYPALKQTIDVDLSSTDEKAIQEKINSIEKVVNLPFPPDLIEKGICKKCAYYELCMI